jgi:uncharacterized protein (TIGR02001 family)
MRTSLKALAAATLTAIGFIASPAFAQDETIVPKEITFSGYVQGVSDYRFRGLSASGGDPAIQGSINVNHSSGIYAGAWASSIQGGPVYGHTELDLYAGWTGTVTPGVTADAGLLYYAYPNGHFGTAEYFEPYASLSTQVGPVNAKVGAAYAWKQRALDTDGDGRKNDNLYVYGELSGAIPTTPITLTGHLGYADGAQSPKFLTGQTNRHHGGFDYSVGASYNVTKNLSVSAAYVGVDGRSIDSFSDDTVVASIKLAL